MQKTRNWLAAFTLAGLLAFQAVPAFADVVITSGNTGAAIIDISASYGLVFDGNTLNGNVWLYRVNTDGTKSSMPIVAVVDPADPTHKTLRVRTLGYEAVCVYELRIKPGATPQSAQPTSTPTPQPTELPGLPKLPQSPGGPAR